LQERHQGFDKRVTTLCAQLLEAKGLVHEWQEHAQLAKDEPAINQYVQHLQRCVAHAFAGAQAVCSGAIDPTTGWQAATAAGLLQGSTSWIPLGSMVTAAAAAGIKLADKKSRQRAAQLLTIVCSTSSVLDEAAELAAFRMGWVRAAQLRVLSTAEYSLGSSEGLAKAAKEVVCMPTHDNTDPRVAAREDANLALAPLLQGEHKDLDRDGLARVLYEAMGGPQHEADLEAGNGSASEPQGGTGQQTATGVDPVPALEGGPSEGEPAVASSCACTMS
jgi:hypothetical protein